MTIQRSGSNIAEVGKGGETLRKDKDGGGCETLNQDWGWFDSQSI